MYSLWQNGVELGRLIHVTEESSPDGAPLGLTGVLFPLASVAGLRGVRQTRFASLPGSPVVQESPDEESRMHFVPGLYIVPVPAFARLAPDGSGVPLEVIFSIRTKAGVDVPSYAIGIERHDLPPDVDASVEMRDVGLPEDLRAVFVIRLVHEAAYPPPEFIEAMKMPREGSSTP